jgi:hypothetical protein
MFRDTIFKGMIFLDKEELEELLKNLLLDFIYDNFEIN